MAAPANPDLVSLAYPASEGVNNHEDPVLFIPQRSGSFIQQATNMRIFRNRWRTRYQIRALQITGPDLNQWRSDNTQAAIWYLPQTGQGTHYIGKGDPRIIESAAGRMYCLTPIGNQISVTDISGGIVAYAPDRIAWLTQAENYVFRTDGASMTQIWEGSGTVFGSPGYNSNVKERSRFPNAAGPTVYAGGYMWATLFGRRLYVSDSLHQTDQIGATDLLKFTTQSYDTTNVYFAPPTSEGDIAALTVSTSAGFDNSRAQGEVLAMCRGPAVWGVTLGIPRVAQSGQGAWATADMRHTRSLECAATGPNAFFVRDGDILMRTSRGIESMNLLARERVALGNSTVDLGANMYRVLQSDDEQALLFASLINPARWSRMLCTVSPVIRGSRHWHMGWASATWNPAGVSQPAGFAWEGVQTLPRRMGRIIQFLPAVIDGRTVVNALVDLNDGQSKGVVQFGQDEGHDIAEDGTRIPIEWSLTTHPLTTGGIYKPTSFGSMYLSLWQMRTDIEATIYVRSDKQREYLPWKKVRVRAVASDTPTLGCPEGASRRLTLGKPTLTMRDTEWVQFKIVGTGVASVDFALRPDIPTEPPDAPDGDCVDAQSDPPCQDDPFDYARCGPEAPASEMPQFPKVVTVTVPGPAQGGTTPSGPPNPPVNAIPVWVQAPQISGVSGDWAYDGDILTFLDFDALVAQPPVTFSVEGNYQGVHHTYGASFNSNSSYLGTTFANHFHALLPVGTVGPEVPIDSTNGCHWQLTGMFPSERLSWTIVQSPPGATVAAGTLIGPDLLGTQGMATGAITITNVWLLCAADGSGGTVISGETSTSIQLTEAMLGHTLRLRCTATNTFGSVDSTSSQSAVISASP